MLRLRKRAMRPWVSRKRVGASPVNASVKFKCSPASTPSARAICAARSESFMNTMALTEVIDPSA